MRRPGARLAAAVWKWSSGPAARRFDRALGDTAATQARYLGALLASHQDTEFGRLHDFASIGSPEEYRRRVPIRDYADFVPFLDRIRSGARDVLTAESVISLAPTSGTGGGSKLIPYTAGLHREFARGVGPWIHDLFRAYPALGGGPMYWAVTPLGDLGGFPESAVRIGFQKDADYFGGWQKRLARRLLVVPDDLAGRSDLDVVRVATIRRLLAERELRLLSVWNPTFLDVLFGDLIARGPELIRDIHDGRGTRRDPGRARELERHLEAGSPDLGPLWPRLALISCWADSWAARSLGSVRNRFPRIPVQAKGLLATEAFVTLPLSSSPVPVLAVCSHFFEFEPEDGGRILLAHELVEGREYEIVVTTGGGLYRYRLGDRVRVDGHHRSAPCLRFVGRSGGVSDLRGEKLHPGHVEAVLDRAFGRAGSGESFRFLAPNLSERARYLLFVETDSPSPGPEGAAGLARIRDAVEAGLRGNPHYRYARDLGQLDAVALVPLRPGARQRYFTGKSRCGQLSVIKTLALETGGDWWDRMAPEILSPEAAGADAAGSRAAGAGETTSAVVLPTRNASPAS